jgi:hypothetical protein
MLCGLVCCIKKEGREASAKNSYLYGLRPRFCRLSPPGNPWPRGLPLVGRRVSSAHCLQQGVRCSQSQVTLMEPKAGDPPMARSAGAIAVKRFVFFTIESTSQKPPHLAILPVKTPSNSDFPPAAQLRPELSRYFVLRAISEPHQRCKTPEFLK